MPIENIRTSAGTRIYISATPPATYVKSAFDALTFTEIGEVSNLGEFGRKYNEVTFNPLATRNTVKRKGSYNEGNMSMELARDPKDPGQDLMRIRDGVRGDAGGKRNSRQTKDRKTDLANNCKKHI